MRRFALSAFLFVSAASALFDLTLPLRLPREEDWVDAAGAVRAEARRGDAVQIWPAWAERARLFIDSMPVVAEEDLASADYVGIQRLWVVALPRTPFFRDPSPALSMRGATRSGEERRFGALALRAWDLHPPALAADLTPGTEANEVDYVARRCLSVAIGARHTARGQAGSSLHVRAGVIGERAYDPGRPPVEVDAFADGAFLGRLAVPRTERDGTGWRRLDVALPAGAEEREFTFHVRSTDPETPFCLQAWTTR